MLIAIRIDRDSDSCTNTTVDWRRRWFTKLVATERRNCNPSMDEELSVEEAKIQEAVTGNQSVGDKSDAVEARCVILGKHSTVPAVCRRLDGQWDPFHAVRILELG